MAATSVLVVLRIFMPGSNFTFGKLGGRLLAVRFCLLQVFPGRNTAAHTLLRWLARRDKKKKKKRNED